MALPANDGPADRLVPTLDETPAPRGLRHLARIARSFGYAFEGLALIVRTQPNFWVHVSAACLALLLGVLLHLNPDELAIIVLSITLVMVVEAVNSGIETMCDLISPGHHPLIKRAKDISAAAVLIAAAGAVLIALLLFGPRLLNLLR